MANEQLKKIQGDPKDGSLNQNQILAEVIKLIGIAHNIDLEEGDKPLNT
jgi:hypothetical protein